jgi:hypothetical protein
MDPERREQLREYGRRGAAAKWAKPRPGEPFAGTFLDFLEGTGRSGPSRATWRVFWKAADGLPLDDTELTTFRQHTARDHAPTTPARECWLPAGRRAGKSENMASRATWRAISRNWKAQLQAGELGVIPLIAADRAQARNSLSYLKGLTRHRVVAPYVARVLRDSVEFTTGAVVQVATASFKSTRGYTMLDVILEECAFYASEDSANPDEELLTALRPALLTVPGARVYGISSPYARRGILWQAYERHWGRASDVLVFNADTLSLNPLVDAREVARALDEDPAAAASEYGQDGLVAFRVDIQSFLSREAVEAVTVLGRRELAPAAGRSYVGFVDVSGGSQDSYTLGIAHAEDGVAVLDALRETRPPFSPEQVTADYAALLRAYHLARVTGDKYGGEFPRELFAKAGIQYVPSERVKSDLYRELLPVINARRCELLDEPRLKAQLVSLERRVARGGKDSFDHAPGARDDVANAVAGALVLVGIRSSGDTWVEFIKGQVLGDAKDASNIARGTVRTRG